MKFSFFSLFEPFPQGFEKKDIKKRDLLQDPTVILSNSKEDFFTIFPNLEDRVIGVIAIPNKDFQLKKLGTLFWEMHFPGFLIEHLKDITVPILCLLENTNILLDTLKQTEIELSRTSRDFLETTQDYQRVVQSLQKKVQDLTKAQSEILALNQVLEKRVELRTLELSQTNQALNERNQELSFSLESINLLKSQQDADYALTSLLLEPLSTNNSVSKNIDLEFFTKQKKSFPYKNKFINIGGDIIVADNIVLNKENCTLFLNADAMGKSLQGACGSLVLGVIFKSIVTYTQLQATNQKPEKWLINTVSEIHRIFDSFEGRMQATLVMGIIEEKTDTLYYVNAEHPNIVLFRDGSAQFLKERKKSRKIGSIGIKPYVHVERFQLKSGDSIFIGSDGKDDIILKKSDSKKREINFNEKLFLNIVVQKKGNLKQIVKEIEKRGELMDDLSILKISYGLDKFKPILGI
ncbi:MAG: SpoIIE family protein phosphatase [Leptospiraceae bacterium]|nr:SpoIIE family protein phosphatase [Leptospiraceae bacterium]